MIDLSVAGAFNAECGSERSTAGHVRDLVCRMAGEFASSAGWTRASWSVRPRSYMLLKRAAYMLWKG